MRYGNDYATGRGWSRGGMDRGAFRGRGGDHDTYSRREFVTARGDNSDDFAGGRGYGGAGRRDIHVVAEPRGHRYFGHWANQGEDDTWESDRHWPLGYGRPPARMMNRGRGYGADFDRGRGWTGGRGRGGYDRGW
ncbi:MAG TPA: hypothetical protein VHG51_07505 [Longimicrobiaceae bacterium]|nr:hypothetical protein [Longimicrobiaceae bacterium]